jgi:hypothetical protein
METPGLRDSRTRPRSAIPSTNTRGSTTLGLAHDFAGMVYLSRSKTSVPKTRAPDAPASRARSYRSDFATPMQARRNSLAESVRAFRLYGLVVCLPLLSTPPRGDAVTVDNWLVVFARRGFEPRWSHALSRALTQPATPLG